LGAEQYGHVVIAAHLDGVALDTINAECVAPKRNMGGRASNALSAAQAASDRALVEVAERVSSAGQPVVSLRVRGPRALKLTRRVEGFVRADEIVVFDGTEQHHRSATLTVTATVAVTELKRAESPATTAGDVAIPLTVPGVPVRTGWRANVEADVDGTALDTAGCELAAAERRHAYDLAAACIASVVRDATAGR